MKPKAGLAFRIPVSADTSAKVPSPRPRKKAFCDPASPCGPHITGRPFHMQSGRLPGGWRTASS